MKTFHASKALPTGTVMGTLTVVQRNLSFTNSTLIKKNLHNSDTHMYKNILRLSLTTVSNPKPL